MLSGAYGLSSSTVLQIAGKVPNTHGIMQGKGCQQGIILGAAEA